MRAIRQGDVLLLRLRGLPRPARRRQEAVLSVPGENGHRHLLKGAELFEHDGQPLAVVAVGETAVLEHDEHPAVSIPAGVWEVRTPRVFDWPEFRPEPVEERATPVPRRQERSVPYED